MNAYLTGATIKQLRETKCLTQTQLAELLGVTAKAVSKWETGKGLPDITLIQPLAVALGVSVVELMSGEVVQNQNLSSNLLRSKFYVCPLCGNILHATGNAMVSCCGIPLPPLEAEETDDAHAITIEKVEDEYFVTVSHEMTPDHGPPAIGQILSRRQRRNPLFSPRRRLSLFLLQQARPDEVPHHPLTDSSPPHSKKKQSRAIFSKHLTKQSYRDTL